MASSRRTLDVDILTLRQVNIRGPNNTIIPSTSVLVSDGKGGTYWSQVSTIGSYPSFNQLAFDSNIYTATPGSTIFTLSSGTGIGFVGSGSNNVNSIFTKAFQKFLVNGQSSITAYTGNALTPTVTFSSIGGLAIKTDPASNVLYFDGGIKSIRVLSNSSSPTQIGSLPITLSLSTVKFAGIGDIYLQTVPLSNTVNIGINGFTASGYKDLQNTILNFDSTVYSTVSSLYTLKTDFSTGIESLSTGTAIRYQALSTFTFSNISTLSSARIHDLSTVSTENSQGISTVSTNAYQWISTLSSYFYQVNQSTLSTFIYKELASTTVGYTSNMGTQMSSLYSTLRVYGSSLLLTEFLSTTSSFINYNNSIQFSSLSTTQSGLSTMSTTMTSTFFSKLLPKYNLISSLGYTGSHGDHIPFTYNTVTGTFATSTATLCFKDVVSSIRTANTDMYIEYNPVLLLPMASNWFIPAQTLYTNITYEDGSIMDSSVFQDTLQLDQFAPSVGASALLSNLYSKSMKLRLDADFILQNGGGVYTIYHYSDTIASNIYNLGTNSNSTLHNRTSLKNSLFLNLFTND